MDLNNLKPDLADEGVVMEVVHPDTEEPIDDMTITLMGQDSAAYRKLALKKQQAVLSRLSKGKKAAEFKAEQIEADAIDELVALTVTWTGFDRGKDEIEPTPKNFREIYTDFRWIREQAQEFVANRANFFRKAD